MTTADEMKLIVTAVIDHESGFWRSVLGVGSDILKVRGRNYGC